MDLKAFETRYLDLFFLQQRLQWENYTEGKAHDLTPVDESIYNLCMAYEGCPVNSRRSKLAYHIVTRSRVDNRPCIASLRNKIDNWGNYGPATLARSELSLRVTPDVVRLMELRDFYAREEGYASYVDLALTCDDAAGLGVEGLLERYLSRNLAQARMLVHKYNISLDSWFEDLRSIGSKAVASPPEVLELVRAIDLTPAWKRLSLTEGVGDLYGYTGVLAIPNDVRMLVPAPFRLSSILTRFHELGHALFHVNNKEEGLYTTWTPLANEAMAVVMEQIGVRLLMEQDAQSTVAELRLLENVRCALSFLFELELWNDPQDAEGLYIHYYSQLVGEVNAPYLWSLDTFRSLDPVYVYTYVLGAMYSESIVQYLEQTWPIQPECWGPWLVKELYSSGRKFSMDEKLERAGVVTPTLFR